MILTRVKEATSEFIKVLRYGKSDVQTALNILPKGVDSKPVKEDLAVWSKTSSGDSVIIGYVKKSELVNEGEIRIYSTDSSGSDKFSIYIKNNGNCELGGNTDNAVRYSPLNQGLQDFITNINTELGKIATGISGAGGSYVPTVQQININDSKIDEIETL